MGSKHRSFWKWLVLFVRSCSIKNAQEEREMREFHEQWARDHQAFIRKCDREIDREIERQYNNFGHEDDGGCVGYWGGHGGDGGHCGHCGDGGDGGF